MDVPFNGAPKRPGSPSPLTSPAHSTASRGGLFRSCCGRCYPQRYQVRGQQHILASTTSISDLQSAPAPLSSSPSHNSRANYIHNIEKKKSSTNNTSSQPLLILDSIHSIDNSNDNFNDNDLPNVAFHLPGRIQNLHTTDGLPFSPYNETRV